MANDVVEDYGKAWTEPVPDGLRETVLAAGHDYDFSVENDLEIDLAQTPDPQTVASDLSDPPRWQKRSGINPYTGKKVEAETPGESPKKTTTIDVTEESLQTDGVWIEASRRMMELNGDPTARIVSDAEAAEYGKEFIGWFNYNIPAMAYKSFQLINAPNGQKLAMLYLMEKYEQKNISWAGTARFFHGLLKDPSTYIGLGTLGIGLFVGASAKQLTKTGFKSALKAAIPIMKAGSIEGGFYAFTDQFFRENLLVEGGRQKEMSLGALTASTAVGATLGMAIPPVVAVAGQGVKKVLRGGKSPSSPVKDELFDPLRDQSDGRPLAANSSGDGSLPSSINSPGEISAVTQAEPSQLTTSALPSGNIENLTMTPPILRGAKNSSSDIISESAIKNLLSDKKYHTDNDMSSLLTKARERAPAFKTELGELVSEVDGASVYGVRIKKADEIAKKMADKGRTPSQISDYLGGRIVVKDYKALEDVLKQLDDEFKVIELDNALSVKKRGGYRAVHYQIIGDDGFSMEIQIQPREIREVQDDIHKIHYAPFKHEKTLNPFKILNARRHEWLADRKFKAAWEKWAVRNAEGELPYDHSKYFKNLKGSKLVSINKIVIVKSMADKGIKTGKTFMQEAADGRIDKRDPITVKKNKKGIYTIVDGSSTFNNALKSNWKDIPVNIVKGE